MTSLAAGECWMCAVLSDQTVDCWGDNTYGQLGNGSAISSNVPVPIPGLAGVVSIAAGGHFTCAVLATGKVECWGYGDSCELGNYAAGACSSSRTPVLVNALGSATKVATTTNTDAPAARPAAPGAGERGR